MREVLPVPRSVCLAAWGTAWLRGLVPLGAAVSAGYRPDDEPTDPLADQLRQVRASGATGLRVVLPIPGDVAGLPGPVGVNRAATAARECVVTVGGVRATVLVPEISPFGPARDRGTAVAWRAYPADDVRVEVPGLAEAHRALTEAVLAAADSLAVLDLARWRPGTAQERAVVQRAELDPEALPPLAAGTPAKAPGVLANAARWRALVTLALGEDGVGISAHEFETRSRSLRGLDDAARRAVQAAGNAAL